MEYSEKEYRRRLEKEINRLQERAKELRGEDKELFDSMAYAMNLYVRKLDGATDAILELDEMERQQAVASIINVLNEIDVEIKELSDILSEGNNTYNFSLQEATCIIDRFFYNCQIAEDRIKNAREQQYISQKQVSEINEQLNKAVMRIIDISRRSDSLVKMLQEKYGADVAS